MKVMRCDSFFDLLYLDDDVLVVVDNLGVLHLHG